MYGHEEPGCTDMRNCVVITYVVTCVMGYHDHSCLPVLSAG